MKSHLGMVAALCMSFFFQAEDGIRDVAVTGVQTCALPIFSVVDRVLFRGLPYAHDDRLVSFGLTAPIEKDEFMLGASYVDFRRAPGLFEEVTSMLPGDSKCDLTEQSAVRLSCARVERSEERRVGKECRSRWSP